VLSWFRSRAQDRRTAVDLYGAIVTQARRPEFFDRDGVLDTPEGRTAMIILLMFPVLERLSRGGADVG
jgi:cytochrome b pre-mRNA-processing protein 3